MNGRQSSARTLRLVIGAVLALVAVGSYLGKSSTNALTGEVQQVSLSPEQEIATGLAAVPELTRQYGGNADPGITRYVTRVGERVVSRSAAGRTPYRFRFVVLADRSTINAFALPGGPVFITEALLGRLGDEAQLAGVLGHEIAHVVARHGAQQLAKSELAQGLVGAAAVAAEDRRQAQLAQAVSRLVVMKYGRDDELESDALGVRFMAEAGYDASAMVDVLRVLKAAGGGGAPEFFSTHPDPANRIEEIARAVASVQRGGERNAEAFRAALADRGEARQVAAAVPPEAKEALARIAAGGPFPYARDGVTFENREGLLPDQPRGYYREYTVETPGSTDRGARRIVVGRGGERYYTDDHYQSFTRLQ